MSDRNWIADNMWREWNDNKYPEVRLLEMRLTPSDAEILAAMLTYALANRYEYLVDTGEWIQDRIAVSVRAAALVGEILEQIGE